MSCVLPVLEIADDVEPRFGSCDGYIEDVGLASSPRSRAVSRTTKNEDNSVVFLALEGVDCSYPLLVEEF